MSLIASPTAPIVTTPSTNDSPFTAFSGVTNSLGIVTAQPVAVTTQPSDSGAAVTTQESIPSALSTTATSIERSLAKPSPTSESALATQPETIVATSSLLQSQTSIRSSTTDSSPSTTSVVPAASSSAPPHGLSTAAKVGVGLGVPLGIIILAIIGFVILRQQKFRKISHVEQHENTAAARLYPNEGYIDNAGSGGGTLEIKHGLHEIHGTEVPAHSRELEGSPGVRRHELPVKRNSV